MDRCLHKRRWKQWQATATGILGGYCAATEFERFHKQLSFLDLPRTYLVLPLPSHKPTLRNDDIDDERLHRRLRSLIAINAVGKATRMVAERAVPATPDPTTINALRELHPAEPTTVLPSGPIPQRLVRTAVSIPEKLCAVNFINYNNLDIYFLSNTAFLRRKNQNTDNNKFYRLLMVSRRFRHSSISCL